MRDDDDLPDVPSTGDGGEVVSVELPAEETPAVPGGAEVDDVIHVDGAEEAVAALEATGAAVRSRWFPETVGGVLYLLMLVGACVALLVVVLGEWRTGIRVFAGVLFAGAAFRLVLPRTKAGMLAVRSRPVDVLMHLAVGGVLLFLATSIPDQPN